jgi:hypothetical protein
VAPFQRKYREYRPRGLHAVGHSVSVNSMSPIPSRPFTSMQRLPFAVEPDQEATVTNRYSLARVEAT